MKFLNYFFAIAISFILVPVWTANAGWTGWYNVDAPHGTGDWEMPVQIRKYLDSNLCLDPTNIECRRVSDKMSWTQTGEVYRCNVSGGVCVNADQPGYDGSGIWCDDYEVRFFCPDPNGTLTGSNTTIGSSAVLQYAVFDNQNNSWRLAGPGAGATGVGNASNSFTTAVFSSAGAYEYTLFANENQIASTTITVSKKTNNASCTNNSECASGHCISSVCRECGDDEHCSSGEFCNTSNVCETPRPNGSVCRGDAQCSGGLCVDSACGNCMDDTDCAGGEFCNESNICEVLRVNGEACVTGSVCESGYCESNICASLKVVSSGYASFTVNPAPEFNVSIGYPSPYLALSPSCGFGSGYAERCFVSGQEVMIPVSIAATVPDYSVGSGYPKIQIKKSGVVEKEYFIPPMTGTVKLKLPTMPYSALVPDEYEICYDVAGESGIGIAMSGSACVPVRVSAFPFTYSIAASKSVVEAGESFIVSISDMKPSGDIEPKVESVIAYGPISGACPSDPTVYKATTILGVSGENVLDGTFGVTAPYEAGTYVYETTLSLNGVSWYSRTGCIVVKSQPPALSIIRPETGFDVGSGRQFAVNFAAGPITANSELHAYYDDTLSETISGSQISNGIVVLNAGVSQNGVPIKLDLHESGVLKASDSVSIDIIEDADTTRSTDDVLVPVIYVIAQSDMASDESKKVFDALIGNLSFFTNLKHVSEDFVMSVKRDYDRFIDMMRLKENLERYYAFNNTYPVLATGTFIPGFTTSIWPSWFSEFASAIGTAPVDPINRFGNRDNYKAGLSVIPASDAAPLSTERTESGGVFGFQSAYSSVAPVNSDSVDEVLYSREDGAASAWIKYIGEAGGSIMRLFDIDTVPAEKTERRALMISDICSATRLNCGAESKISDITVRGVAGSSGPQYAAHAVYAESEQPYIVEEGDIFRYDVRKTNPNTNAYALLDDSDTDDCMNGVGGCSFSASASDSVDVENRWVIKEYDLSGMVGEEIRSLVFRVDTFPSAEVTVQFKNARIVRVDADGSRNDVHVFEYDSTGIETKTTFASVGAYGNLDSESDVYVYFDPQYAGGVFMSTRMTHELTAYLSSRGAKIVNADELSEMMDSTQGKTIVMATDAIPDTVMNTAAAPYLSKLRSYVNGGGTIIFTGDVPGRYVSHGLQRVNMTDALGGTEYAFLSSYEPDPCPGHDPQTCWSDVTRTFACPYNSHIYAYSFLGANKYRVAANFENPGIKWSIPIFEETWDDGSPKFTQYVPECSDPSTVGVVVEGGVVNCGDGIVRPPFESCEYGDVRDACDFRTYYKNPNGGYTPIPLSKRGVAQWHGSYPQLCTSACTYESVEGVGGVPVFSDMDARCNGFCGDGILQTGFESCDESFDPTYSAMRCSDGSIPECASDCLASCGGAGVIDCGAGGFAGIDIFVSDYDISLSEGSYTVLLLANNTANAYGVPPNRIVMRHTGRALPTSGSFGIPAVPIMDSNRGSACGYAVAVLREDCAQVRSAIPVAVDASGTATVNGLQCK